MTYGGDIQGGVNASEFKTKFGKYLDIFITKNGKPAAKAVNPNIIAVKFTSGLLIGKLLESYDVRSLREERLNKYTADD